MKKSLYFLLSAIVVFYPIFILTSTSSVKQERLNESALSYVLKDSNITHKDIEISPISLGSRVAENVSSAVGSALVGLTTRRLFYSAQDDKTNLMWLGLATAGSTRLMFPVIRQFFIAGVEAKVKKYLDFCDSFTFANKKYNSLDDLRNELNTDPFWKQKNEVALYIALNELVIQSNRALILLDALSIKGVPAEEMFVRARSYADTLKHNRDLVEPFFEQEIMMLNTTLIP
jgi:hypothetical protein